MTDRPLISIIIATFNSERTLSMTLESIKKQDYPQKKIDVLVIDGGSTDKTLVLAKKNKCKIIPNPLKEPIPAKHIGYLRSRGKYAMYLDSDEVLESASSLTKKVGIFALRPTIKAVIPSGYKTPGNTSLINHYINEFGDPFSFFIYNLSKNADFFIKSLKSKYKNSYEDKKCIVFNLSKVIPLPIIELVAMGSMIDLKYFRANFPQIE